MLYPIQAEYVRGRIFKSGLQHCVGREQAGKEEKLPYSWWAQRRRRAA